jgi:hypothetical protein
MGDLELPFLDYQPGPAAAELLYAAFLKSSSI